MGQVPPAKDPVTLCSTESAIVGHGRESPRPTVGDGVLDLPALFREVTKRGGPDKVTSEGKWDEVASALNIEGKLPDRLLTLQQHYLNHLADFDQNRLFLAPTTGDIIKGQITSKADEGYLISVSIGSESLNRLLLSFSQYKVEQFSVVPALIQVASPNFSQNLLGLEIKIALAKEQANRPSNTKASKTSKGARKRLSPLKKDADAPRRNKSAYHFFISKEFSRLKQNQASCRPQGIRKYVNATWKSLSTADRQPYIEESNRDRERYQSEMEDYRKRKVVESGPENRASWTDDTAEDYHVSLEAHAAEVNGAYIPDEPSTLQGTYPMQL